MKTLKILCASVLLLSTCGKVYAQGNLENIEKDSEIKIVETKENSEESIDSENLENDHKEDDEINDQELNNDDDDQKLEENDQEEVVSDENHDNEVVSDDEKTNDVENDEITNEEDVVDSVLPASVDAVNPSDIKTYAELQEALANASEGDVLELASDFDMSSLVSKRMELVTPSVSVTVDAHGLNFVDNAITVKDGSGTLILKNFIFVFFFQAVYVSSRGTVIFDNFKIMNGEGANGGAINIDGGGMSGNFTLKNSTILNNSSFASGYTGGGIYTDFFNGTMILENNVFEGNKTKITGTIAGGQGGAIFIKRPGNGSNIKIRNNYFTNNEANINNLPGQGNPDLADGGAIALFDIKTGADISIESNTFYKNIAGADGGAMLVQFDEANTTTRIRNNTFYKNTAMTNNNSSENSGGAIQLFQAGKVFTRSYIELSNNTFVGNVSGTRGGAIASSGAALRFVYSRLINNVFVDNKGNSESHNNFSGYIDLDQNNIGLDGGTNNYVAPEDVFGTKGIDLYVNKSTVYAGSMDSRVAVKTLPILPKGLADNKEDQNINAIDQRYYERNSAFTDLGAVEIKSVEIDANGGTWSDASQNSYDGSYYHESSDDNYFIVGHNKEALSLDVSSILSRQDYILEGFNSEADGSGDSYEINAVINTNDDLKVYAMWKENKPVVKYSLSYDGNGNTAGTAPIDSNEYLENEKAILMGHGDLEKSDSIFVGWNTKADGSGTSYKVNDKLKITEDTTLYAMWSSTVVNQKHTLSYDGNGHDQGVEPLDLNEYKINEEAVIQNQGTLVKTGYTFKGWNTKENGTGVTYNENDKIVMIDHTLLYAMWSKDIQTEEKYTVVYDGNGNTSGNAPVDSKEYLKDESANIMSKDTLVKEGYNFVAWNTEKDGSGLTYKESDTIVMIKDLSLYAIWAKSQKKKYIL